MNPLIFERTHLYNAIVTQVNKPMLTGILLPINSLRFVLILTLIQLSHSHLQASHHYDHDMVLQANNFEPFVSFQTVNLCKIYNVNFACQFCIRDHYLANGLCNSISYSSLISGCNIYANATTCYQCDNGLFLSNNAQVCVVTSTVIGCLTYSNQTTCAVCQSGFALTNGLCAFLQNCVSVSDAGICTTCATGYYSNSAGICVQVSLLIANCQIYSSNSTCRQCNFGYALSSDFSTCFSASQVSQQVDSNCVSSSVNNGQQCAICSEGYNLVNNVCVQLSGTASCFIVNPSNTAQCSVCAAGHSQSTSNGICTINSASNQAQVNPRTNATDSILTKMGLFSLLIFILR